MGGLQVKELSEINIINLEKELSEEEILDGLKDCNGDETSRPDSFNMKFLQEFLHVVKGDLLDVFSELHESDSFVKSLNSIKKVKKILKRL